jgi:leucine-rich repeat protein SHOC2
MKTLTVVGLSACFLALVLVLCAKNSGTNPNQQSGAVFDWSDTLALRAILDSNGLNSVPAGGPPIATITLENGNIHRITELTLVNKNIKVIPARIEDLTALQILRLDSNTISALPPEIGKCVALNRIQLSNNDLTTLPMQIGSLDSLKALVLSHNAISFLPQSLWSITALSSELDLDHNQLDSLSSQVSGLVNLSKLTLNNNKLTTLPVSLRLDTLLEYIQIDSNYICSAALAAMGSTFVGWLSNRAEQNWDSTQTCQ